MAMKVGLSWWVWSGGRSGIRAAGRSGHAALRQRRDREVGGAGDALESPGKGQKIKRLPGCAERGVEIASGPCAGHPGLAPLRSGAQPQRLRLALGPRAAAGTCAVPVQS